jgi:Fic family protein
MDGVRGQNATPGLFRTTQNAPLPPSFDWTPRLIGVLSEADRLIGRLAGEGGRLPNPHILMRPFVRREAVLSSKIEGTQATLGELLAAEAGAVIERSPEDLREVGNYVVALEHGISLLRKLPLSARSGSRVLQHSTDRAAFRVRLPGHGSLRHSFTGLC